MLLIFIFILGISCALAGVYIPNTPPVLILGIDVEISKSIFKPVRSTELSEILKPLRKDHMFVVYMAPELTSKDFSCKDCYPFTRQMLPRSYFSQVQRPLKAIEQVGEIKWPDKGNTSTLTRELEEKISCRLGEIYAFNFTDRQLEQHDAFIHNISEHFSKCSHKLLHIYTSYNELAQVLKRRRWRRSAFKLVSPGDQIRGVVPAFAGSRRSNKALQNLTVLRNDFGIVALGKIVLAIELHIGTLTYYERSTITIDPAMAEPLTLAMIDFSNVQKGFVIIIKVNVGYLTITVLPFQGNWLISRLTLNGNTTFFLPQMPFFGNKFSLCCNTLTAHTDNGTRLSLYSFYLDIVDKDEESGVDPKYKAKPCWSCDKYVSTSILQGVFTLIILVSILAIGVIMIWDIGRTKRMQNANQPDLHIKSSG